MRMIEFEYHIFSKSGKFKHKLYDIISCSVRYTSLGSLKTSANLIMREDKRIDYLNDRIKIFCKIDGTKYPLGEYLLSSTKRMIKGRNVIRECTGYGKLLILQEDKIKERYVCNIGTNVINEVKRIIGSLPFLIEDSLLTLKTAREWEPGTAKLQIINDLLDIINWNSLRVTLDGKFTTEPYIIPSDRIIEHIYSTDVDSIIYSEREYEFDSFSVPNVIVMRSNAADVNPPLSAVYENHNADSPTSIENRGREIVYFEEVSNVVSQDVINDIAKKRLYEKTDVYSHLSFSTAIEPDAFDYMKCIYLKAGDIADKFIQTNVEIECKTGGIMKREARRIVKV